MAAALCAGMVGVPLIALSGSDGVDPATTVMAADDAELDLARVEQQRASRSATPTSTTTSTTTAVLVEAQPAAEPEP